MESDEVFSIVKMKKIRWNGKWSKSLGTIKWWEILIENREEILIKISNKNRCGKWPDAYLLSDDVKPQWFKIHIEYSLNLYLFAFEFRGACDTKIKYQSQLSLLKWLCLIMLWPISYFISRRHWIGWAGKHEANNGEKNRWEWTEMWNIEFITCVMNAKLVL